MTFVIRGGKDDIQSFITVLAKCTGKSINVGADGVLTRSNGKADPQTQPMLDELDKIINDANRYAIHVRHKAAKDDPVVDAFCKRPVIAAHLEAFPEPPPADNPSGPRAASIILAEYGAAFRDGYDQCDVNFAKYHKKGIEAQTALRKTLKQCAAKQNVEVKGKLEMQHCDGTKTTVTQDPDTGSITVDHGPKETKPAKETKFLLPRLPSRDDTLESLFATSPYVFSGEIEAVDEPPLHWSNFFLSYQCVRYGSLEFVRGWLPGVYLDVHHLLVENTASANRGAPGLNAGTFAPGQRLLVFAEPAIDPLATSSFRLVANHPRQVLRADGQPSGEMPTREG